MTEAAGPRRLWRSIHRADLFSAEDCRALVALADARQGWREARVTRGGRIRVRRRRRRARQLSILGGNADPAAAALFEPWLTRVEALVRALDRDHFGLGISRIADAQLVEYERGGFYDWHPDSRDLAFRKLTALCYLTDRASDGVRGGETRFAPPPLDRWMLHRSLRRTGPGLWRWLPVVQTPVCGRVIVFDSRISHCAHRVRGGRKVSLNVWFV